MGLSPAPGCHKASDQECVNVESLTVLSMRGCCLRGLETQEPQTETDHPDIESEERQKHRLGASSRVDFESE